MDPEITVPRSPQMSRSTTLPRPRMRATAQVCGSLATQKGRSATTHATRYFPQDTVYTWPADVSVADYAHYASPVGPAIAAPPLQPSSFHGTSRPHSDVHVVGPVHDPEYRELPPLQPRPPVLPPFAPFAPPPRPLVLPGSLPLPPVPPLSFAPRPPLSLPAPSGSPSYLAASALADAIQPWHPYGQPLVADPQSDLVLGAGPTSSAELQSELIRLEQDQQKIATDKAALAQADAKGDVVGDILARTKLAEATADAELTAQQIDETSFGIGARIAIAVATSLVITAVLTWMAWVVVTPSADCTVGAANQRYLCSRAFVPGDYVIRSWVVLSLAALASAAAMASQVRDDPAFHLAARLLAVELLLASVGVLAWGQAIDRFGFLQGLVWLLVLGATAHAWIHSV